MSAVAYYFARHLRQYHDVPIGVIDASWGGAPLAAFTPLTAIASDPALQPALLHWSRVADRHATTLLEIEKERRTGEPRWRPDLESWAPAGIYNAMIAPLTPHAIRGVIWYQGESDGWPERAPVYARLFAETIHAWRRAWGVGEFPFLFVQLANWTAGPVHAWPELREAQRQTLSVTNTAMTVAIDVGHPTDIHPRDKKTVGTRLALAARALAYGEALPYSGPLFRQATPEGSALRVHFDHAEGLTARGGPVAGFEVAGDDGKYMAAEARIEGTTVVASSAGVPAPRAVRYGWADNPVVSLYNGAGLPASPFRSRE
jgi:sialate O-acetylesterase